MRCPWQNRFQNPARLWKLPETGLRKRADKIILIVISLGKREDDDENEDDEKNDPSRFFRQPLKFDPARMAAGVEMVLPPGIELGSTV